MPRHIDAAGLDAIRRFEACRLLAYQDPAGIWTIGYGSTRGVHQGLRITQPQAEDRLRDDLAPAEQSVELRVTVPLTDGQFAALVSFVFNVGAAAFARSTLLKKLNTGAYGDVPAELQKFRFARGKPLPGLAARRAAEAGLWARGAFVAANTSDPSIKIRGLLTPETTIAGCGTFAALAGAAATPGPLQYALALLIVAAVIGLAALAYRRFYEV